MSAATAKARLASFLHARGVPEDDVAFECRQGGLAHEALFEATASALGLSACGTAHRKKTAEGEAADALLLALQRAAAAGQLPAAASLVVPATSARNRAMAREWQQASGDRKPWLDKIRDGRRVTDNGTMSYPGQLAAKRPRTTDQQVREGEGRPWSDAAPVISNTLPFRARSVPGEQWRTKQEQWSWKGPRQAEPTGQRAQPTVSGSGAAGGILPSLALPLHFQCLSSSPFHCICSAIPRLSTAFPLASGGEWTASEWAEWEAAGRGSRPAGGESGGAGGRLAPTAEGSDEWAEWQPGQHTNMQWRPPTNRHMVRQSPRAVRFPLPFVVPRHRRCPVFPLPSRLRHYLRPVFPLPSWLRHCPLFFFWRYQCLP